MRLQCITDQENSTILKNNSKSAGGFQEAVIDTNERELAEQAVINAEKYKAILNVQPGKSNPEHSIHDIDDKFFHISCHIDQALMDKCHKGEYVELDKLLAKLKIDRYDREEKIDIIKKEGQSYLVTSKDKDVRINNVRKWEQAFRVYAAIYSKANPSRAAEIWQYVHVIHTAATSYRWDNVAYYDVTFRHLMASNPQRSWAKTYTQGWSLAMRDPIQKHESYSHAQSTPKAHGEKGVCWRYNKNKCKFGTHCRFDHKCSYCGGNHPAINCQKKSGNKKEGEKQWTVR